MQKSFFAFIAASALFATCQTMHRNDLVTTEIIAQIDKETIIYSVYQIDFDAFNVHFKAVAGNDTTSIFTTGIADGVYSKNSFRFRIVHDTLIISDPRQTKTFYYESKNGTILKHTGLYN